MRRFRALSPVGKKGCEPFRPARRITVEQGFHPCYSKEMAKVTSKLQLTIPKVVADQYGIRPGDNVELSPSGGFIRMVPPLRRHEEVTTQEKVRLFKQLLERHRSGRKNQSKAHRAKAQAEAGRGWKREDLYTRGSSR